MCSHKILTNITGFEDVVPWKPTITESFRQTRSNNETFLNNLRAERMVVSACLCTFKIFLKLFHLSVVIVVALWFWKSTQLETVR